jgi:para-aminobenzoate synthetase/4-amino-4-deoxychorismate lyase
MTLERYPTFLTLTSTIAGTISEGVRLEDIVRATFPCGSVTGAPKRSAMEYIARCEPDPRGTYCGSIGFLSPRRTGVWNVAIRTMQIRGTTGTFHAGGGIVADSDASSEWNEIAVKSSFLRAYTAPLELLEAFASNAAEEAVEAHLARLSASASVFGVPLDSAALRAHLTGVRATNAAHMIRLRVSADGAFRTATEPLVPVIEPVPICLAAARVRSYDPFLRHKTAWRPAARAAWETARAHGCFDAVLRNERDELTEGSRTNLYIELDGELWTPPVESGLLPGIGRSRIVTHGQARERVLTCDDLARADAVFVGNSARGILRATMVQTAQ